MSLKRLSSHLGVFCQDYVLKYTFLFPENRYRPPNHHIAHGNIRCSNYLFSFNKIGSKSHIINTTSIESSATSHNTSAWYQCNRNIFSCYFAWSYPDKSLNKGSAPSDINFLVNEILVEIFIPEISFIWGYYSHWIYSFVFIFKQNLIFSLTTWSEIISVGKIESISKVRLYLSQIKLGIWGNMLILFVSFNEIYVLPNWRDVNWQAIFYKHLLSKALLYTLPHWWQQDNSFQQYSLLLLYPIYHLLLLWLVTIFHSQKTPHVWLFSA